MKTTTITKSAFFNAARDTVWSFLIDKDKLGEWYYPAEANLIEGQDYSLYQMDDNHQKVVKVTGRVIEMNAPSKLVTTFVIGPFQGAETILTWILEDAAGGTRLSLTHEGIAEATDESAMQLITALESGWDRHLSDLRKSVM